MRQKFNKKNTILIIISFLILISGWKPSNFSNFFEIEFWLLGFGIYFLIYLISLLDSHIYKYLGEKFNIGLNTPSILIVYFTLNIIQAGLVFLTGFYIIFELQLSTNNQEDFSFEFSGTTIVLTSIVLSSLFIYTKFQDELKEAKKDKTKQNVDSEFILVGRGNINLKIVINEISFFYLDKQIVHLVKTNGEIFSINESLARIKQKIKKDKLFSANRQFLVSKQAIVSWKRTSTRRLIIETNPKVEQEIFVSKNKSVQFVEWIQNV